MTIRILTGTYAAGYSLLTTYTGLRVERSAVVTAMAGAAGVVGEYATAGGGGGAGVTIDFAAVAGNLGAITGGAGGVGGDSQYASGAGKVFRAGAGGGGGAARAESGSPSRRAPR